MKVSVGRQKQVARGNRNRAIAEKLFITEETVKETPTIRPVSRMPPTPA
jgi:FixJ family two-component response regulator